MCLGPDAGRLGPSGVRIAGRVGPHPKTPGFSFTADAQPFELGRPTSE